METDISGRNFQVTKGLKEHVIGKVDKLQKYSLKLEAAHVVLEVQKFHHIAEITILGKNLRITAKEESSDMYAAFDSSYHNIQLQLARYHDKIKDHKAPRYNPETEENIEE